MLQQMWTVLTQRSGFFLSLAFEHLEISLIAIFIAILFGDRQRYGSDRTDRVCTAPNGEEYPYRDEQH